MNEVFRRVLSKTEAERHFIRIPKAYRSVFPPTEIVFKIKIKNEEFNASVDRQGRIWTGSFCYSLPYFKEGSSVSFYKEPYNVFKIISEKS
ncbi:MAG: hypothetical protein QG670_1895 [Thermoproteota archaeon]|nr:hypothetical protein [Thermoproteota archaeon]